MFTLDAPGPPRCRAAHPDWVIRRQLRRRARRRRRNVLGGYVRTYEVVPSPGRLWAARGNHHGDALAARARGNNRNDGAAASSGREEALLSAPGAHPGRLEDVRSDPSPPARGRHPGGGRGRRPASERRPRNGIVTRDGEGEAVWALVSA
jgi:cobalt-zinc-cadmium resistance protein CzcA